MSDKNNNRRNFLKNCGLASLPLLVPGVALANEPEKEKREVARASRSSFVNFVSDGLFFSPQDYIEKLSDINSNQEIQQDFYGNGGATKELEQEFAKITGKEKAIFVPTGTMANQLAIKLLNGHNTKVIVPENSHIFRDEADAAQSVHAQRLIPAGKDKAYFDLQELKDTIAYYDKGEVFKSGLGVVAIENPIRRADGTSIPLQTLKEISAYCRQQGYKLHLDGARIHLAAAYTGVSIAEYSALFDTVYISLYKYLNAPTGAILCGDAELIDQMAHQIKILGGTTYQTWGSAALALHYLKGLDERWKATVNTGNQIISDLNKMKEISITKIKEGTNIYNLRLDASVDFKKLDDRLYDEFKIWLNNPDGEGNIRFSINESLNRKKPEAIVEAFKKAIRSARA
ncbi:threonine aldolase [Leptobacterium flavescens]|uniref:Threonine aldolase n=1 Tax=Leptobacterium flavescens TaxID=472055 RepID=A0A6P0ULU7_9FLAO|nr:aminotransferase class I/II-fold pyridoxal phosphate-dependent enzyme [Leptobacterium flavescens]NER13390.1 threonine aldolase [Leptobacterium flavescens]